jgi:hypothetical protein
MKQQLYTREQARAFRAKEATAGKKVASHGTFRAKRKPNSKRNRK